MSTERLTEALEEFERITKRLTVMVRSGILAGSLDAEYADEVVRLNAVLRLVRARLYQVVARVRVTQGKGPLVDDLLAVLDAIDEGGTNGVSGMPRSGEGAALRVVGGPGNEDVR